MRYLPHTEEEIAEMLAVIGQQSLADLFAHIPADTRFQGELDIPGPLSEWDLTTHLEVLGQSMFTGSSRAVLIGAGSYDHHIPEIVRSLSGRSEFLTAYTPYQPEMAQGTLQGIFEFQTLTARLLGMEVANASMYDAVSGVGQAVPRLLGDGWGGGIMGLMGQRSPCALQPIVHRSLVIAGNRRQTIHALESLPKLLSWGFRLRFRSRDM